MNTTTAKHQSFNDIQAAQLVWADDCTDDDDDPADVNADVDEAWPYQSKKAATTTRFTQLLFNPVTGTVAATEVEQKHSVDLWSVAQDDWRFYNGRKLTRKSRSKQQHIKEIVVPNFSSSSSSCSSSCSSLSEDDTDSDDVSETDIWEELIDMAFDMRADDGGIWKEQRQAELQKPIHETMPFVMSTLPLSSMDYNLSYFDEDEPLGSYLLSDDDLCDYEDSSNTAFFHVKRRNKLYSIRWKDFILKLSDVFNKDDAARILWYILTKGKSAYWCGRMDKSNGAYESL